MHPFFSVTLFTGQQLVLEALQRWLQRPCPDAASQARRRMGLKSLIALLLRTAATGVLATLLDAAIEFRRRQLLAVAAAEPGGSGDGGEGQAGSRFPGLGMLSRAGVAAWKSRLLLAIDELERRAGEYGIESRHRFSPSKSEAAGSSSGGGSSSTKAALPRQPASSCVDLSAGAAASEGEDEDEEEGQSQRLGRTVEQLRELVKQGDPESQRRLDDEVGSLVDLILGTTPPPPAAAAAAAASAAARSRSVPASLDRLWAAAAPAAELRSRGGSSSAREPSSPSSRGGCCPIGGGCGSGAADSAAAGPELCAICMDRSVTVQVAGCRHSLCFGCARQLCASQDHLVPLCPFCRQAIDGFVAMGAPCCTSSADAACGGTAAATACAHA